MYSQLYQSRGNQTSFFLVVFSFVKDERVYVTYTFNEKSYFFDILVRGSEFYQFFYNLVTLSNGSSLKAYDYKEVRAESLLTHENKTVRNFAKGYMNKIF